MMANILVVDDEEDICSLLEDIFTDWGHSVCTAHNGFSALKMMSMMRPSVVFLDLRMPGMKGQEVLREMSQEGIDLKVIVMTADDDDQTQREALSLGALEVLSKPFEVLGMKDRLKEILPTVFCE